MNAVIGVRGATRELQLDLDITDKELLAKVEDVTKNNGILELTANKNQRIFIPARAIGYVLVEPSKSHRVGFALD